MKSIAIYNIHGKQRAPRQVTAAAVRAVLSGERCRNADVSVVFVNSRRMIRMNSMFLNHRYDTDVISFPLSDPGDAAMEGEVYVNLDRARAQAGEFGETPGRETARLVIHGVLHLLGYDDATPRQRKAMTAREDRYLERLFRRTRATT